MRSQKRVRVLPEIPTASMADIAFLLIVFFLTSTSMNQDKGLSLYLPAMGESKEVAKKNICNVWINEADEVAIYEEDQLKPLAFAALKGEIERRLTENGKLIVSVKSERGATYRTFVNVLDELKLAGATRISIASRKSEMKFYRKSKVDSVIPTASMADISFLLIIFFMVSTVFVRYRGLPVELPEAAKIEKLESRRNVTGIWIDRQGQLIVDDQPVPLDQVAKLFNDKMRDNPRLIVSVKGDEQAKFGLVSDVLEELRRAEALRVNFATDRERAE